MANISTSIFYGIDSSDIYMGIEAMSLQFHITAKCDQKCKHCYMYDSVDYTSQLVNTLSKAEMFQLVDEYFAFLKKHHCSSGSIYLTGGDPILSPYFWDLVEYIHKRDPRCFLSVLGNSYHIDESVAKKMKDLGVQRYQISLDGMRETHDFFRKPGSFDDAVRALQVLHDSGLSVVVSFTLSKMNSADLIPLYDFLAHLGTVDIFGFDRLVPTGNAIHLQDTSFSPIEYRDYLFSVLIYMLRVNYDLRITMKDNLWRLLLFELGFIDPLPEFTDQKCVSGCMAGVSAVAVLADGSILPCRKMSLSAGKFPEKSFEDIVVFNPVTQAIIQHNNYRVCNLCPLLKYCRGCRAIQYAVTGNMYTHDQNCWRKEA